MTLLVIPDVLDATDCQEVIDLASARLHPATVLGPETDFRIADNTWIYERTVQTDKLKAAVAAVTGLPVSHQEDVHVVHYGIGGKYDDHDDAFHPGSDYFDQAIIGGGQRSYSCMVWLNDGYGGGDTEFPLQQQRFSARTGSMLVWSNLNEYGRPDLTMRHAGRPVMSGDKWVAIVWVRESTRGGL